MSMADDLLDMWEGFGDEEGDERPEAAFTARPTDERFDCTCLRESEKALLVQIEKRLRWVPKSQIRGGDISKPGDTGTVVVSAWLARQWADEDPEETAAKELENDRVAVENCVCLRDSEKAVQVRLPDGQEAWFPRSQFRQGNEIEHDGDSGTLAVSKWIARQKGLAG